MQGITRLLSSPIRLSMMRKNIALTSTTCKTNTIYDPNFLVADSPSSCCLRCISDQSRKRRKSSQKFDWERENSFNDETAVEEDTEIFSDEGRTRYHFMLKGFGVMCYIFFCNLGYFIRLKLRELKKADIPKGTWRDSVYWRNKTLTGFMTLSYVLAVGVPIVAFWICHRCVRNLWLLQGGKAIRVQTFAPFFLHNTYEVPIQKVSGMNSRAGEQYVLLHLKKDNNKILRLSMSNLTGTFKDTSLYDNHIGQFRDLKSS
ncbi:uncharacterized protein LOC111129893 [Crassostrea virginica]|uniref:Uncharacterized protein LOC111129893 n=1 Tax=Crassostrea virginica TaxID=6565 RepID=A0A8B8DW46_CRAVI|nr:uncharacterized protein LOC111129893 [Crassostrea virginica]XP_022332120.1 uncharacterized protein LOC111129893 [Crassostrea virginica]